MCCTAHLRPGACEVWVPTQSGSAALEAAAKAAGLDQSNVTIHMTQVGGAFGGRHRQDWVVEAIALSKLAGAPVQVVWTREDDIQHDLYRPATYNVMRAGLDAAGKLVAWTHRIVAPGIASQMGMIEKGPDWSSIDGAYNTPYAVPDMQIDLVTWDPGVPLGWWRSVSASQNAYVIECFLDEVAAAAGRDPLELRRELLQKQPRHLAVLERAAREAGWGAPPPAGVSRGLAVHSCFDSFVADVAEVEVANGAVRVRRVVCAVDCGIAVHPDLVRQQMESAVVYGLSAALKGEITIARGRVEQSNFGDYPMLTVAECPAIEVHLELGGAAKLGGIGEPGLPPVAPAVANAVARATGKPVRKLPIAIG
jgi:isoquinoline 1-oxidoreductase subunit beta